MLCLAMGHHEEALEWVEWCLHGDQLNDSRTREYACIQVLLQIRLDDEREYRDYADSLALMYGADNLELALALTEGREHFHGLHSPGLSLEGFDTHARLLDAYRKLHKAKKVYWETFKAA
jgi:ribosomal protein S12 methylthiotransferase accessory factor